MLTGDVYRLAALLCVGQLNLAMQAIAQEVPRSVIYDSEEARLD